jgi:hypothetical protein
MLVYYRLTGVVACIALMLQVTGQLLALSVPQFTLTLPGIAVRNPVNRNALTRTSSYRNESKKSLNPEKQSTPQ